MTTLWRPTGPQELARVEASGWRAWPPRLPEQPIFYPVLNRWYATRIAREWNVPSRGVGYVTGFDVDPEFLARYDVQQVGGRDVLEYWIPAAELDDFNRHMVGHIELVAEYRPALAELPTEPPWADYLRQKSWFRRGFLTDGRFVHMYRPDEAPEPGVVGCIGEDLPIGLSELPALRTLLDES
jgi:hypothetical protein